MRQLIDGRGTTNSTNINIFGVKERPFVGATWNQNQPERDKKGLWGASNDRRREMFTTQNGNKDVSTLCDQMASSSSPEDV